MDFKLDTDRCKLTAQGCANTGAHKLSVFDWFSDLPETKNDTEFVEVQFKNTRKGYYSNPTNIDLKKGDIVAVEATPGHDIGEVTLVGRLVLCQMRKNNFDLRKQEVKRVYRIARQSDIEKWEESKAREHETMIRSRQIAEGLKLNMKIGDVEFQGDGNKAIFYYIADERVDFRQLIKDLAEAFHVRIEMKQIGARQEAGRIGGIGPCGRQLCCSTWMTSFNSVSTSAARYQDLSLNPQKLAGQCTKLKCCMNYELDTYIDATKDFPHKDVRLETKDATYFHFKTDVFKRQMTYSTDAHIAANLVVLSVDKVKEVIAMNKRGEKPERLEDAQDGQGAEERPVDFHNVVGQDSVTRFDKKKKHKKNRPGNAQQTAQQPAADENTERSAQQPTQEEGGRPREGRGNRHRHRRRPSNDNKNNTPNETN